MEDLLILVIILIPIILWISSAYMLSNWIKFKLFFVANSILVITYVGIIIYGKNAIWEHDEYGLGMLFRLAFCLITHVLIVFIFALFKRLKTKNTIANNV